MNDFWFLSACETLAYTLNLSLEKIFWLKFGDNSEMFGLLYKNAFLKAGKFENNCAVMIAGQF